jgi:uncharacterized protein (TIGR03435 family)
MAINAQPPEKVKLGLRQHISSILGFIFMATSLASAEQLKFEEASVKRAEHCAFNNTIDPGMIALHGDPLIAILREAFKVKTDQIVGPSWLDSDSDCFTIDATIPQGTASDQLPAMLQALLVERFKLVFHKEIKLRAGYALVVDKNGPKFKESDPNSPSTRAHAGEVTFGASPTASQIKGSMTTASLARFVSRNLDAPVEDATGLKGRYDIDVSWAPDWSIEKKGRFAQEYEVAHPDSADNTASLPTGGPKEDIFTSFRNSLGLRLERRKESVEVIVIDHIEHVPTAN